MQICLCKSLSICWLPRQISNAEEMRSELKIIHKNGFIEKFLELVHAHERLLLKFKKSKLHIDEKIYKKSIKFKLSLGKRKENSMKLILNKKWINLKNFGKAWSPCTNHLQLMLNATKSYSFFSSLAQNLVSKQFPSPVFTWI